MKGLILVCLVLCGVVRGGEYCETARLHINGISHHTGTGTYNEKNFGLGLSCEYREGRRWAADAFFDSHNRPSGYGAHEWDLMKAGPVSAGVMAGAMYRRNGYELTGLHVFPFALPYASLSFGRVSINGYATPQITKETGAVFALQVRISVR